MRRLLIVLSVFGSLIVGSQPAQAAPANDNYPGTEVTSFPFGTPITTFDGATLQHGEPRNCEMGEKTLWWHFTPSSSGTLFIGSASGTYRPSTVLYTRTESFGLIFEDCSGYYEDGMTTQVDAGTEYFLQVGPRQNSSPFTPFELHIGSDKPGDKFPGQLIGSLPFWTYESNTTDFSTQPGEPYACDGAGPSMWFEYSPDQDIRLRAETDYASFDTVLAVWQGSSLNALELVTCNDDKPRSIDSVGSPYASDLYFEAEANESYFIQIAGFEGDSGYLDFSLAEARCPNGPDDDGVLTSDLRIVASTRDAGCEVAPIEEQLENEIAPLVP